MPKPSVRDGTGKPSKSPLTKPQFIVLQFILCGACLSTGFGLGINYGFSGCTKAAHPSAGSKGNLERGLLTQQECDAKLQQQATPGSYQKLQQDYRNLQRVYNTTLLANKQKPLLGRRFETNVNEFLHGMAYVKRDEFIERFDMGVPIDPGSDSNDKVVMLYNHDSSLPSGAKAAEIARKDGETQTLNVFQAVHNCDFLNVVMMQQKKPKQCTAIIGQYASYHIQKWMRLPPPPDKNVNGNYGKLDSKVPLQLVNRGAQVSGRKSTKVPSSEETRRYWKTLRTYLETLPDVLEELKPLAKQVAKQNTVVVMLANHGQSELLLNFVCGARSRGLDISSVLIFATDQETKDLAEGIGLTVFFDKTNYGKSPVKAAGRYGDATFTAMMMAKIYCVQMVTALGYDVLFQDVDVIWYRNALEYFHDEKSPSHGFDIYFQDDGNRAVYYAPYSANTGFYYVRANDLTRYFFNSLLMSGDLIYATHSHQIALVAILSEYASRYGMKAKVLSKFTDEFPGGDAYHNRRDFMKDLVQGKVHPYIFHMSWTENKNNKKLFFRQMGEWYVQDKCISNTAAQILGQDEIGAPGSLIGPCCSGKALFSCHYRDKPSREPCPDAKKIDPQKGIDFW